MKKEANTPEGYLDALEAPRKEAMTALRKTILEHLPDGFEETISYGMIGYVVPHSLYPSGYHCDPKLPLPFMNIASQKSHIAFYHMGLYADPALMAWFLDRYSTWSDKKLDMGKSCLRFKRMEQIPFSIIGELVGKVTPEMWIQTYEKAFKKK